MITPKPVNLQTYFRPIPHVPGNPAIHDFFLYDVPSDFVLFGLFIVVVVFCKW